jgi:hypothetical protein
VQSSHNFFFNNTVINASIASETNGTENYYSQNYLAGGSLSTAGVESFFNSTDVSSNLFIQASDAGPAVQAQNAATTNGTPLLAGPSGALGNDQWQLVPTDSGFYRLMNERSHLAMNVSGASLSPGARVIQWPFGSGKNDQWMPRPAGNGLYYFVNRLSGLCLDIPAAVSGAQLDQQPYTGAVNQQFSLHLLAVKRQPWIAALSPSGSNLVISGSNGVAGWPYLVLTSGNLALPAAGWAPNETNAFDSSGNFIFTNAPDVTAPQLFYLLRLQ